MSAAILQNASHAPPTRRALNKSLLIGRLLTGIAMAFLTFDTVFKLFGTKEAVDGAP